jgi:signal transduction histidine kinase
MTTGRAEIGPARLATIPVVLCVVLACVYRIADYVPVGPFTPDLDRGRFAVAVAAIVALGAVHLLFAFRRPSRAVAAGLLAVQVLLAYGPYAVVATPWSPPVAFVVAAVLLTFTGWWSWAFAALVVVCDVAVRVAVEPGLVDAAGEVFPMRVAYAAVVAVANGLLLFGVTRLSELLRDVDAASAGRAAVAVTRERLRTARHLEAAVGGRLAAIIAGARRDDGDIGPPGDRARALAAEAREALAREVAAAQAVLTAAGVEVVAGPVPERLPAPVDAVLAAVLRRTVLDVLRGSPPQRCVIELDGSARLRVRCTGGEPGPPDLEDVAAQVEQLGGRLRAGSEPGTREVEVQLPAQPHRPIRTTSARPVAGQPWLAWVVMAVLEFDLLVTTVARSTGAWDFVQQHRLSGPELALVIALIVPLSLLQLHHVRPRSGAVPPWWRWTLGLQIVLLCTVAAVGGGAVPAPQYAGTVAGVVLFHMRRPVSWVIAAALILGTEVTEIRNVGFDFPDDLPFLVPWTLLAMVGVAALCRLPVAAEQVLAARQELARLAVLRERLRIARDTHDVLGSQLSAIVLTAELAGRTADARPGAAPDGLAEVGRLAEEALNSVRSITAQPAELSFTDEVRSARSMLASAGTRVTLELNATPGPSVDGPLAIVLREAVTNVVRHSRATMCTIGTRPVPGGIRLRVANDGVLRDAPPAAPGNGLANLRARAHETGGELTVDRHGEQFTLVALLREPGRQQLRRPR